MYNKETLQSWNMTPEECEKETKKITIKGMRLTYEEKESLLFYFKEGYISEDDIESQITHINDLRKDAEELKNDIKIVKKFVKEWKRLELKYSSLNSDLQDKSLDELTEMWMNNYFELYFMEDHFDCIKDTGAKEYAQYYCYNVGICPESEVSIWQH